MDPEDLLLEDDVESPEASGGLSTLSDDSLRSAGSNSAGLSAPMRGALTSLGGSQLLSGLRDKGAARAKLQEAADQMTAAYQQRSSNSGIPILAWASAMLKPTVTGSFFESLGNAGTALVPALARNQEMVRRENLEGAKAKFEASKLGYGQNQEDVSTGLALIKAAAVGRNIISVPGVGAVDATTGRVVAPVESKLSIEQQKMRVAMAIAKMRADAAEGKDTDAIKNVIAMGHKRGTPEFTEALNKLLLKGQNDQFVYEPDAKLAEALGVPISDINPFKGMTPKGAEALSSKYKQAMDKEFSGSEAAMATHQQAIDLIKEFTELNKEVSTGGVFRAPGVLGDTAQAGAAMFNKKLQRMEQITAELSRKERQPGEGATSDFDAKQFIKATLSAKNAPEVNEMAARARLQAAQNAIDREEFKRDYGAVNGHLLGWDRAWKKYLSSNPIFNPKAPDKIELNPDRKSYKEFFGVKTPAAAPVPEDPAALLKRLQEEKARREAGGSK